MVVTMHEDFMLHSVLIITIPNDLYMHLICSCELNLLKMITLWLHSLPLNPLICNLNSSYNQKVKLPNVFLLLTLLKEEYFLVQGLDF